MHARKRHSGNVNVGANAGNLKPPKFKAVAKNGWTSCEKAAHLLTILHGQAVDILHGDPAEATYIKRLARRAFGELPIQHMQEEAPFAFIDRVRDQGIKQHFLMGDERRS